MGSVALTVVPIEIKIDLKTTVIPKLEKALLKDGRHPYFHATMFYFENDIDMNRSAELMSLALEQNPGHIEMIGKYMGQAEPGSIPRMFAPNFISTEENEFGSVFSSKGTESYFGEVKEDRDIWYVTRTENGWSDPINAGPNINSAGNEYYISFTNEGKMYFSSNINAAEEKKRTNLDIYYSKFVDGKFQKAISLGDSINTDAYEADVFVDPEEKYLIFCGVRSDGFGQGDLYISFKNSDGSWTKSVNMGNKKNTQYYEYCPFVTKDGKYLFYTSNQDIYWVSMEFINEINAKSK